MPRPRKVGVPKQQKRPSTVHRKMPLDSRLHWEELRASTIRRVDKLARHEHDSGSPAVALRAYSAILTTANKVVDQYMQTVMMDPEHADLAEIKDVVSEIRQMEKDIKSANASDMDSWVSAGDDETVH